MWEKPFRYVMVVAIYRELFWQELFEVGSDRPDFDFYLEQVNLPDGFVFDNKKAKESFNYYLDSKESLEAELVPHFEQWQKTYKLVKAILFGFLIESMQIEKKDTALIVGKYIRLAQDLIGGKNTSLVHAVLSKITQTE